MEIPVFESNSGVYAIICLVTGKRYIGSSKNLRKRLQCHRNNLRHGRHPVRHLQNAWNSYGESQFAIEIVEYCSIEHLLDREQYYLDIIQPYDHSIGFNGSKTAVNAGYSFVQSEEAKAKVKVRLLATRENRIKNAIQKTGKPFQLRSPSGEVYESIGIKAFARKHGLDSSTLGKVISGRLQSTKGWTLVDTNVSTWVFQDPDGNLHEVRYRDLTSFCKKHGLKQGRMSEVKNGHRINHRGWHLPREKESPIILKNMQGETFQVQPSCLNQFAQTHRLHVGSLSLLARGDASQYLGWTVVK